MLTELPQDIFNHHLVQYLTVLSRVRLLQVCKRFHQCQHNIDPDQQIQFWKQKTKILNCESLALAIEERDFELAKILESRCNRWCFALAAAAKIGHLELVKYYLGKFHDEVPKQACRLAITRAARHGQKHIVEFFIQKGIEITPGLVDRAGVDGHWDILNMVDWNLADASEKRFLLKFACMGAQKQIAEFALEKGAEITCLTQRYAAHGGSKDIVELLIGKGANNWDEYLLGAAIGGDEELIQKFIELGANTRMLTKGTQVRAKAKTFMWRHFQRKLVGRFSAGNVSYSLEMDPITTVNPKLRKMSRTPNETPCYVCRDDWVQVGYEIDDGFFTELQSCLLDCHCDPLSKMHWRLPGLPLFSRYG